MKGEEEEPRVNEIGLEGGVLLLYDRLPNSCGGYEMGVEDFVLLFYDRQLK
jgi:hypothetical protein